MSDKNEIISNHYKQMLEKIGIILEKGRKQAYSVVNNVLVKTYWDVGREIVEYEQKGKEKAEYGSELLDRLSKDLKKRYGKGFSRRNVLDMRRFYLAYRKWQTVSAKLSWSHFTLLLSLSDDMAKSFYEKQCIREKWAVRELKRQIQSSLFQRIALSKDKKGVFELAKKGHIIETNKDIVKDPYVLEFLGLPEDHRYSEKKLEQKIIDNLQMFLLELGKGFTFVGRQFRITLNNRHYFVDLVFYHRIVKCFVLIDLKIGFVDHGDIGQMNMYLNYFKKEESVEDDNEPVGIILSAEKDEVMVEYALGGLTNNLFVSKYQTYLPDKKVLKAKLLEILESDDAYQTQT
jgi:predicted nuclease of restriction endonuclease-like (RecB) superfamily